MYSPTQAKDLEGETVNISEVAPGTLLFIDPKEGDSFILSKEDFLDSRWYLDRNEPEYSKTIVSLAVKSVMTFDLFDYLDYLAEYDTYEGWKDDVYPEIYNSKEYEDFKQLIQKVFESHPSYFDGKLITLD